MLPRLRNQRSMKSILQKNSWYIGAVAAVAFSLVVSYVAFVHITKANPLDIITSNTTATTTLSYLTAGNNIVTYTYDSYGGGVADPNATDQAAALIQFTASSTSSVLSWNYQFSQNGVDWYDDNTSFLATTTATSTMTQRQGYTWTAAGTAVALKAVELPATPTRFVRMIFYTTGANAGVWATFIAQKQQPE